MKLKKKKKTKEQTETDAKRDINTERTRRKEGEREGERGYRMGDMEIRGQCWEESLLLVSWGAVHQAPGCQHRMGHGPAPDAAVFHEEVWGVVERACCLVGV